MSKITQNQKSDTEIVLQIIADAAELAAAKDSVLSALAKTAKVPGFRAGKAPLNMVEKAVDQETLQNEFLNTALSRLYADALAQQKLRPMAQPKVELTKFVPYTTLECTITIVVIGPIKLGDYKKLKARKVTPNIEADEIDQVIKNMQTQMAEKKDVERAAKAGDQVYINFSGTDEKGQEVKGAKGDNYPLMLGSNSFIPGFEDNVVGMKAGDDKSFTLTFPKDYGVKALQSKKVTFAVSAVKVQEVIEPTLDTAFIEKVAPGVKDLAALKKDIEKQLIVDKDAKAQRDFENALVAELVEKSTVVIPQEMIDEQAEVVMRDLQQNLMYRGQSFEEYCEALGMTPDEQREKEILPEAERRLKAGILLSEVSEKEDIGLTPEELEIRLSVLRQRYASDAKMIEELKKPENQQEVGSQVLTEKTVAKIVSYTEK